MKGNLDINSLEVDQCSPLLPAAILLHRIGAHLLYSAPRPPVIVFCKSMSQSIIQTNPIIESNYEQPQTIYYRIIKSRD